MSTHKRVNRLVQRPRHCSGILQSWCCLTGAEWLDAVCIVRSCAGFDASQQQRVSGAHTLHSSLAVTFVTSLTPRKHGFSMCVMSEVGCGGLLPCSITMYNSYFVESMHASSCL